MSIPAFLRFIYGETTCLCDIVLIHGSARLAGLYVLFVNQGAAIWSGWQQLAAVLWPTCYLKNRDYWRRQREASPTAIQMLAEVYKIRYGQRTPYG